MGTPVPDPYELSDTDLQEAQRVAVEALLLMHDERTDDLRALVGTLTLDELRVAMLTLVSLADRIGHLGGRCTRGPLERLRARVEAGHYLGRPADG